MEKDRPSGGKKQPSSRMLEEQMQQVNLGDAASPETPESARFRSLPQATQRRLLVDYPCILATAIHRYSQGEDCESILMQEFEASSEMLRVRNAQGDNPMAAALVMGQDSRAEKLVDLAGRKNPAALDGRSQYGETLLMLSTSSSSAANLMERLLQREPTQLHRLYDNDGRNFLHHCIMEESIEALDAALQLTAKLIQDGRLRASQVSAAIHMNDRSGDTPLHMMARGNRRDMLTRLEQFGSEAGIYINLDVRQHRGNRLTPLMTAATNGAFDAAEFLLDRGADPTEVDTEDRTAGSMAAGNAQMMQLFQETDADSEQQCTDGVAAAAAAAAAPAAVVSEESDAWMTKDHPVRTVDSGMGTCGDLPPAFLDSTAAPAPAPASVGHLGMSAAEIQRVEAGLRGVGKVPAFLAAFQASHAPVVMLAQMSEKPVVSLISQLAHDPQCRRLVLDALRTVGEPQLVQL